MRGFVRFRVERGAIMVSRAKGKGGKGDCEEKRGVKRGRRVIRRAKEAQEVVKRGGSRGFWG